MKNILLWLSILITSCNTIDSIDKCEDVREGEFVYLNEQYKNWRITRTSEHQIEKSEVIEFKGAIRWLDSCKYELEYIESSEEEGESMVGKKLTAEINKISGDTIWVVSKMDTLILDLVMLKTD